MGSNLGYVGAGGMAGLSASLDDLVKSRMVRQLNAQHQAEQAFENDLKRHTMAQADARIADEGRKTDLDYQKFGETQKQYGDAAPQRAAKLEQDQAQTGLYAAQSAALARKPEETQQQWQQRLKELSIEHQNRMGEIGAQGANALSVARVNNQSREDLAGKKAATQDANEVADSIALIDQIKKDPSFAHAFGPVDQYAGGIINADPAGVNRVRALTDQLIGKMSLAQAGKLKGQGQISDKERAMLASAASAIKYGLSEKDALAELDKVGAQFQRMQGGAPAAGALEYDYVPGKGLVPRAHK